MVESISQLPWAEILSLILLIVSGVLAKKWRNTKKLLAESAEALTELSKAVKDDELTQDEVKNLVDEFQDIIDTATEYGTG